MSSKVKVSTLAALALTFVTACPPPPPPGTVWVRTSPPAVQVEAIGTAPGIDYIWIPGHHHWNGTSYLWVGGRWELRPRGRAHWVPGHWRHRRGYGWYWVEGYWKG